MKGAQYPDYPEILRLKDFVETQSITTEVLPHLHAPIPYSIAVAFRIENYQTTLYPDNEYQDFNTSKPLLMAELSLSHLADIEDSEDILQWGNWLGLEVGSRRVLDYYRKLVNFNDTIRHLFENQKIESFVNSYDFEMNQKAAQALRNEVF